MIIKKNKSKGNGVTLHSTNFFFLFHGLMVIMGVCVYMYEKKKSANCLRLRISSPMCHRERDREWKKNFLWEEQCDKRGESASLRQKCRRKLKARRKNAYFFYNFSCAYKKCQRNLEKKKWKNFFKKNKIFITSLADLVINQNGLNTVIESSTGWYNVAHTGCVWRQRVSLTLKA